MANNKWYRVFTKKNNPYLKKSLDILHKKGGENFKITSYELSKVVWKSNKSFFLDFVNFINKKISFIIEKKKKFSIGEYGSGNGFILYYFSKKFKINDIFSFEISKDYLNFQKKLIGIGKFFFVKPKNHKIKLKASSVDIFLISSLFQYLSSYKQAKKLINECIRISTYRILILDIYDEMQKRKYEEKKLREFNLNQNQFKKKYRNLPYRFYKKKFFDYLKNNKKVKKFFFVKMPKTWKYKQYSFCLIIDLKKTDINNL